MTQFLYCRGSLGTDRAFTQEIPPWGDAEEPMKGHLAIVCWADDACAALLEARIRDVLALWDGAFQPFVVDAAERIAAACEADPRRDSGCDPDGFFDFIEPRAETLRALLE